MAVWTTTAQLGGGVRNWSDSSTLRATPCSRSRSTHQQQQTALPSQPRRTTCMLYTPMEPVTRDHIEHSRAHQQDNEERDKKRTKKRSQRDSTAHSEQSDGRVDADNAEQPSKKKKRRTDTEKKHRKEKDDKVVEADSGVVEDRDGCRSGGNFGALAWN